MFLVKAISTHPHTMPPQPPGGICMVLCCLAPWTLTKVLAFLSENRSWLELSSSSINGECPSPGVRRDAALEDPTWESGSFKPWPVSTSASNSLQGSRPLCGPAAQGQSQGLCVCWGLKAAPWLATHSDCLLCYNTDWKCLVWEQREGFWKMLYVKGCCSAPQVVSDSDPMDCSMPGFPVLHYLPELAQTHVHWVGDAIQPSHTSSSPSPSSPNLSQHQGLFPVSQLFASAGQGIGFSASASVLSMNNMSREQVQNALPGNHSTCLVSVLMTWDQKT